MIRNSLLNIKYSLQGSVLEKLKTTRALYKSSYQENLEFKKQKLEDILVYAYQHTEYYNTQLSEYDVVSKSLKVNLENFKLLPKLQKKDIRDNFSQLISDESDRLQSFSNHSGGATGEPVQIIQDKSFSDWSIAVSTFYDEILGYNFGMKKAKLWGAQEDLFFAKKNLKATAGRYLKNELWLNAFIVNRQKYLTYLKKLERFKPYILLAYADAIYQFALFIEREDIILNFSPKYIMTSAGTLHDFMRVKVESVFKTKIINRYGCRETSAIATETIDDRYMSISPIIKVDTDNSLGKNKGNLLITSLVNKSMPLIKYDIGDVGEISTETPTGNPWEKIIKVEGRSGDVVYKKDGSRISSTFLSHYIAEFVFNENNYRQFQLIQHEDKDIDLKLIPIIENHDSGKLIKAKLEKILGPEININIEITTTIPLTKNGKHRFIISKVKSNG